MKLVLIGLLCSLVGGVVAFFAGCFVLDLLYLPSHPVLEWLVTDPYTLAHAVPFFWDGVSVALSLLAGLCVVAPLARRFTIELQLTWRSALFAAGIIGAQLVVFAFLASGEPGITGMHDWPRLAAAAICPGLVAAAVAFVVFRAISSPASRQVTARSKT